MYWFGGSSPWYVHNIYIRAHMMRNPVIHGQQVSGHELFSMQFPSPDLAGVQFTSYIQPGNNMVVLQAKCCFLHLPKQSMNNPQLPCLSMLLYFKKTEPAHCLTTSYVTADASVFFVQHEPVIEIQKAIPFSRTLCSMM